MNIEIKVDTSKFDDIAGVPHPKTGKPIRVRRVVVKGKLPDALRKEIEKTEMAMKSKDEATRLLANIKLNGIFKVGHFVLKRGCNGRLANWNHCQMVL